MLAKWTRGAGAAAWDFVEPPEGRRVFRKAAAKKHTVKVVWSGQPNLSERFKCYMGAALVDLKLWLVIDNRHARYRYQRGCVLLDFLSFLKKFGSRFEETDAQCVAWYVPARAIWAAVILLEQNPIRLGEIVDISGSVSEFEVLAKIAAKGLAISQGENAR